MELLKLTNGKVFDPSNEVDGQIADIWISGDRIIAAPDQPSQYRTIDLQGAIVLPGGVDMHCHIAGPKVNAARKLQPELFRGNTDVIPTIYEAGHKYLGMGYTTAFDAAVSPLAAPHVQQELADLPNMCAGFFVLMGNNHYVFDCVGQDDSQRLQSFLGWLLNKTGGYAPKIVNPGGVEKWKQDREGNVKDLDYEINRDGVTARKIIRQIAEAGNAIGLPHPIHVHTNNLGIPGNWNTTLETMKSLDGLKSHMTHIQFHSYGGGDVDETTMCSQVLPLAEYVNSHPELTVDVGQVVFGETTSMTGDGPLGYYLSNLSGKKWFSHDTEVESGCGISPIKYKNKNFVHSLQWAIGLEWYLAVNDPWQVVMSTDHPNGGSFLAYPQIIRLLMDRDFRAEKLAEVNPKVLKHSSLQSMDREYSLFEIAIITRAGPARILGLENKGHLGPGADADITVYDFNENFQTMFETPKLVFRAGELVVEQGEIRTISASRLISSNPEFDRDRSGSIENWIDEHYSTRKSVLQR